MAKAYALLQPANDGNYASTGMDKPHEAFNSIKLHRDWLGDKYDEAIGFAFPGRKGIMTDAEQSECYDDTAVVAAQEFASRIQAGVTPNFTRWHAHIAGMIIDDEDEKKEINALLQTVDEFIFELINTSNFQTEANECYQDLAVGTMAMEVEEADETIPLVCQAVPLSELHFGLGPDGHPDPIARERYLTVREIEVLAPMANLPPELERMAGGKECRYKIVSIHQRDWSERAAHRYRCTWFMPDTNNKIIWQYEEEGPGSRKIIVTRWSKASGEVWGRGPLIQCLPSMRTVNFAMKAVIDHADMALAGIWSAEDDGVFNTETVTLEPGTIVPRAPGSQPLQNVVPGSNFDIQQFLIEEHRNNIRKALFTEQLGNPNKTPMSATEVDQRMAELARAIGAPFGRLVLEFVMPFVERVRWILRKRKLIKLPEVNGKEIKAVPTSPLAQGQRYEDIDKTTKFIATIGQLFGPEAAALTIDTTEASLYLGERYQVPEKIVRPRKEQAQLSAKIAQAAQGAQGGGMGEGQAEPEPAPAPA
jgi:hypothetical protein